MNNDIERILISEPEILAGIDRIAREVTRAYDGHDFTVVSVLKGSCVFASDLIRRIPIPLELAFLAASSYGDSTQSSGHVRLLYDPETELEGKHIVLVEDIVDFGTRANLTAGIRRDSWRNDSFWSPRVSLLVHATDRLAFTAAAYRAFRAPTLNELYRSFRVGNVLTLANGSLGPEQLSGFEIGARTGPFRLTLFSMTITDAITNVTQTTTPSLITRQRQNFGSSRSRGAELEYSRVWRNGWTASTGYLFADATLSTGARTPEVPRNQATLQVSYRSLAGVQARWSSIQFDDDLNQFPLRRFFVLDLFAARPIASQLEATVAIENIFNDRIETAATPVITLGQPRAVRVGLRYGFRR